MKVKFNPPFLDKLFILHLNKKISTFEGINFFYNKKFSIKNIYDISSITLKILCCEKLKEFEYLVMKHEKILSKLLNIPTIKETYFPDYLGIVKSLGAWGGDFVLISFREDMQNYFNNKGFFTILSFKEIMLQ